MLEANVCIICDRFITGTADLNWIKKNTLIQHKARLTIPDINSELQKCYQVSDPDLHELLLSPRARFKKNGEYLCCTQCERALQYDRLDKNIPAVITRMYSHLFMEVDNHSSPTMSPPHLPSGLLPKSHVISIAHGHNILKAHLDKTIKQQCHLDALKQMIIKDNCWTDNQFNKNIHYKRLCSTSCSHRVSIMKLGHQLWNTNAQNRKFYGHSDLCPLCNQHMEDFEHIFICQSQHAVENCNMALLTLQLISNT